MIKETYLFDRDNKRLYDDFLKLLGWKDLCDCNQWMPYHHTHEKKGFSCIECKRCGKTSLLDSSGFEFEKDEPILYDFYKCDMCGHRHEERYVIALVKADKNEKNNFQYVCNSDPK